MEKLDIELHGYGSQTIIIELLNPDGQALDVEMEKLTLWIKPPFHNRIYPDLERRSADPAAGLADHLAVTFGSRLLEGTHWREARWALDVAEENGGFKTLISGIVRRSF